jgi:hypothetical protein
MTFFVVEEDSLGEEEEGATFRLRVPGHAPFNARRILSQSFFNAFVSLVTVS